MEAKLKSPTNKHCRFLVRGHSPPNVGTPTSALQSPIHPAPSSNTKSVQPQPKWPVSPSCRPRPENRRCLSPSCSPAGPAAWKSQPATGHHTSSPGRSCRLRAAGCPGNGVGAGPYRVRSTVRKTGNHWGPDPEGKVTRSGR